LNHEISSLEELKSMSGKVVRVTANGSPATYYAMVSRPVPLISGGKGQVLQWEALREHGGSDSVTVITQDVFGQYIFHLASKKEVGNRKWSDPINT
jgi:hypothetical protein